MAHHSLLPQNESSCFTENSVLADMLRQEWERQRKEQIKEEEHWKSGLKRDAWATTLILLTHLLFLGWASWDMRQTPGATFWGTYGFEIFSKATDCDQLQHQRTGWSLVVNILAALTGIFSADTLQALSAPTRTQLDACHRDGKHMEIGVQSIHNVRSGYLGWKKGWLWVFLLLMALPFHLL